MFSTQLLHLAFWGGLSMHIRLRQKWHYHQDTSCKSCCLLCSGVCAVKLFEAYNTTADAPVYKNLVRFKGDHNHPRPAFFYSSVCCFFHQQLKLDQVLLGGNPVRYPCCLLPHNVLFMSTN
jgi:hypothetical protein